tara:strand:- start:524 stop:928 length:405 start_codon:yes stop_codon:yes gene_type:complete
MNDIYNIIKINNENSSVISVYITELEKYHKNKYLFFMGNKFYNYLLENKHIKKDTLVILSFVKHYSKSIKNMILSKNENFELQIDSNKIILNYLINSKSKSTYDNYLLINHDNNFLIHHVKKKFSLKNHIDYFI